MWPSSLCEALRHRGHDAVAVQEREDLLHREDEVVFAAAQTAGRAVFTENVADYVSLASGRLAGGGPFHGLLLSSDATFPRGSSRTLGRVIRSLDEHLRARPGDTDLAGLIEWLAAPDGRTA